MNSKKLGILVIASAIFTFVIIATSPEEPEQVVQKNGLSPLACTFAEEYFGWGQYHHPEARSGERFVGNTSKERLGEKLYMGYAITRYGVTAYDKYGNVVKGAVPVFVSQSEIDEKNKIASQQTSPQKN